ncbi:MAG: elongation factor P, partial [Candidatus Krumholzibacteria bacterium]|nr:elongation factor P [Candidatus Krumholzibacteria bacterium]
MASISEFRRGMAIKLDNEVWIITDYQHVSPGNWRAMVRTKLKNPKTGRVAERTFRMTDVIESIRLESREMQFLFEADGNFHFMDTKTYDQTFIPGDFLGEQRQFLKEGNSCTISFMDEKPITVELPNAIDLVVAEAEPGVRGDSTTNLMKGAVLETGAKVQVPLFVNAGDTVRIDTRTGKYIE